MDLQRLAQKAQGYGIFLDENQKILLARQASFMEQKNKAFNLTAIREAEEIEDRHFIDSLVLANQPEVKGALVDIGSGAGFPGVPAKIYKPDIQLTLVEAVGKKAAYLRELAKELGLAYNVDQARAEDLAKDGGRERYDAAVARALASLPILCEMTLPMLKIGGYLIAMKGPKQEDARRAIALLGGEEQRVLPYTLPDGSQRRLVVIAKAKPTPEGYPRPYPRIKKQPL